MESLFVIYDSAIEEIVYTSFNNKTEDVVKKGLKWYYANNPNMIGIGIMGNKNIYDFDMVENQVEWIKEKLREGDKNVYQLRIF